MNSIFLGLRGVVQRSPVKPFDTGAVIQGNTETD